MPRYEYLCSGCEHRWDVFESWDSKRVRKCPQCEGWAKRLFPAPAIRTDATFLAGRPMLGDQLPKKDLSYRIKEARKRGYNPSPHDVYMPTLAEYPGDPKGFIPADNARGHLRRACQSMGVANEEARTKSTPSRLGTPVRMAPDLVEAKRRGMIAADSSVGRRDQREVREEIIAKNTRSLST